MHTRNKSIACRTLRLLHTSTLYRDPHTCHLPCSLPFPGPINFVKDHQRPFDPFRYGHCLVPHCFVQTHNIATVHFVTKFLHGFAVPHFQLAPNATGRQPHHHGPVQMSTVDMFFQLVLVFQREVPRDKRMHTVGFCLLIRITVPPPIPKDLITFVEQWQAILKQLQGRLYLVGTTDEGFFQFHVTRDFPIDPFVFDGRLWQKVLLQGGKQCTQPLLVDAVVVRAANHFLSSGFSNLSREQCFLGCGPPQCGSFCNHVHEYKRKRQRCDVGHSGKSAAGMRWVGVTVLFSGKGYAKSSRLQGVEN